MGVLDVGTTLASEEQNMKPELKLVGEDGNAFFILGRARKIAMKNGMDWQTIQAEATSGDYNNLLVTMDKYFEVS